MLVTQKTESFICLHKNEKNLESLNFEEVIFFNYNVTILISVCTADSAVIKH